MKDKIEEKLEQLRSLIKSYVYDELSLRDLDYLDEQFNELLDEIKQCKEEIVNERFTELLNGMNRGF